MSWNERKMRYVWTLEVEEQQLIYERLLAAGITDEDLQLAFDSRVCDLEGAISIEEWR